MASFGQVIGGGAVVAGATVATVGAVANKSKILEWADKVPMGSLEPKTKAIIMGLGLAAIGATTLFMSGKPPENEQGNGGPSR
ncbi:MAG: hypothetical protein LW823_08995 [Rickettsiales bacterium]|jgi:hypothetical protein|nr:hypothetical protein [Rickettsiales bacterium]